jgi:phage terminase small subunit
MSLNARQIRFCNEYVIDFNGTQAAIRAGYSEDTAGQIAFELLKKVEISERIEERKEELAAAAGLSAEWVLRQWRMIAEADPNELISTRIECCRHCHGIGNKFQWTEFEYFNAVEQAQAHRCSPKCSQPCELLNPPDCLGGFGFSPHIPPAPGCPVCYGDGIEREMVADTRKLKGSARRLYAGLKKTKDGIEIKMRDQDGALANLAKYQGMLVDRKELSGPGGGPVSIANITAADLTDDQLAALVAPAGAAGG